MQEATYLQTAQILPFISGPISFLSSVYILWYILWKQCCRDLKNSPKEHFVLGMALLDACASFGASFSTKPYAHSLAACEAQGFLVQLGLGVPLYNMALSLYYVLSVIWHVSDRRVLKWMVPTAHILIVGMILTTAVIALQLDLYNPDGVLGCWISDAPRDVTEKCLSGQNEYDKYCGRGINGELYQLRFMAYHCAISWIVVLLSMIALTVVVRRTESRSVRWADRWSGAGRTRRPRMPLTQRTTETGVLYSLAFLFVFTPVIVTGTPLRKVDWLYKVMVVLLALFTPLQGFFNLLIYTSPIWLKKLHDFFDERREPCCCCCGDPCLPYFSPQQDDTVEMTQCTEPVPPPSSSLTGATVGRHRISSLVLDPDLLAGSCPTKDDSALRNLRASMFRVSAPADILDDIHSVEEDNGDVEGDVDDEEEKGEEEEFLDEPNEYPGTSTTTDQLFSAKRSSSLHSHVDCTSDTDMT